MSNPILKIPKEQLSGVETPCCQFAHLLTHHFVWNMVILADQLINLSEFGMCCLINITNSPWNFPPQKKTHQYLQLLQPFPHQKKKNIAVFFPPSQTKHPTTLEAPFNTGKRNKERLISPVCFTKAVVFWVGDPSFKESDFLQMFFWCQNFRLNFWLMFPCLVYETPRNWGIVWNCRIHLCSWQILENKPALNRLALGIILYKDQCCRSPMVKKNRTIQQIQR